MTPQEIKVIELALEALLKTQNEGFNLPGSAIRDAITAMKELLAQPEPWEKFCDSNCVWTDHHPDCKLSQPEQEPVDYCGIHYLPEPCAQCAKEHEGYNTPPQRTEQEPVAQCTESDSWNCKYCRKTESCKALQDPRNFASPPQRERVLFPTMLRKMWSGSEVQAWLDENVNKEKNI